MRRLLILGSVSTLVLACSTGPKTEVGVAFGELTSHDGVASVTISYSSQWNSGYCSKLRISNLGKTATHGWTVIVNLNNTTVTSSWDAQFASAVGQLTATSMTHNATIPAGGFAEFGFCATLPGTRTRPALAALTLRGEATGLEERRGRNLTGS